MGRINMAARSEARKLSPMDQKWYLFFKPSEGTIADLGFPYVKGPVLDHKASELSGAVGFMPQ
jgi:hypothetical protein